MAEFLIFLAIFIGIMALSALIFGGWIIAMVFRGIAGLLGLNEPLGPRRPSGAVQIGPVNAKDGIACTYELCRCSNDPGARFCRRCGRPLPAPQHVRARRAAMW